MFDLSGKNALVTGAGSGIGAATAVALARSGAHVYVTDMDDAGGASTLSAIQADGGSAVFLHLDVSSDSDADAVHEQVRTDVGALDILVNNAGIGKVGTILETKAEDLDAIYEVNVKGIYRMSRMFLPGMIERGSGSIINIASIAGVVGVRDRLAYTTSKFAVVGLTKAMALDHAAAGVRVNCICPGRVETEFVQRMIAQYDDPEKAYAEMSATQATGRMSSPEEVAAACVYLAADESGSVTGSTQMVDGGWSAGK